MTGYMPMSPEYKWVNVGGLGGTEILFKILEYYGIFEPTPSETPTPPMTSQEPTILAIQALRLYKKLWYSQFLYTEFSSFPNVETYSNHPENLAEAWSNGEAKLYAKKLWGINGPFTFAKAGAKFETTCYLPKPVDPDPDAQYCFYMESEVVYDGYFKTPQTSLLETLNIEGGKEGGITETKKAVEVSSPGFYGSTSKALRNGGRYGGVAFTYSELGSGDEMVTLFVKPEAFGVTSIFVGEQPTIDFYNNSYRVHVTAIRIYVFPVS